MRLVLVRCGSGGAAWPQAALLDAFRARDGVELIRDAVRLVLRELIEQETAERTDTALTSAPILA